MPSWLGAHLKHRDNFTLGTTLANRNEIYDKIRRKILEKLVVISIRYQDTKN
jgi:hypothetical protein